ncbi:ABC transporter ATP-binding protein [Inconstantimicrobium porci]|uniref:ABC transporter ATP-binding protein n=1 Tax=Inconstantimicrobium porci TaxID=2652291 RepID=A0A7X2MZ74_9CLOT|nr:ABC transporter ATP-binding protein [Inconstantimicrobium porci]MDD6769869.1 ABC transporter ATP-binding protein [Inconstantimicrobium porci]MSR91310.1 ABC transporter ATP-binding protein [Inconstantimicrobium porci]
MTRLLEVKNLKVSYNTYAGKVQSVRGVSFHLNAGETLAIVGESGCGKTVTSKAILGLIQTPPGEISKDSEILLEGKDLLKLPEKEMRNVRGSDISMIFQDPMTSLNPTMTIGKQIAETIVNHRGLDKALAYQEAIKMLKLVNIPNAEARAKQYPHEFSGGMRQRAMIAIALACNPKILLADEPTTALDVTIQAQIMDLIKDLQDKFQTAVVLVTHDLGVVADVADRIQVMYSGLIVERGTVDEIFYNAQHPYTWALLQSVPRLDTKNKAKLYSLNGTPPDLLKPPVGCPFAARCEYAMNICKEAMPEATKMSDSHEVSCWLKHPNAPKVKNPIGGSDDE